MTTGENSSTAAAGCAASWGGLGLLVAGALNGCADDEPHYLPPLPDMGSTATAGVPCEVIKLVADHCIACHNQPPVISGQALVSYADLTALSNVDVTEKVSARMLARMQSPASPMPPGAARPYRPPSTCRCRAG